MPLPNDNAVYVTARGQRLPVIRGGADGEPPVAAETPADPSPSPVEGSGGAEATPPPAEPQSGSEEMFPRKYVEELRDESAKYRTKAKEVEQQLATYSEVFEDYPDDAKQAMLEIARDLRLNPQQAAARMVEVSRSLLGDDWEDFLKDPGPKPLTREDLEKEFQQREEAKQQEEAIQNVYKEARDLGYADSTPEQAQLLWLAANRTNGDLKEADKQVQDAKQAVIDAYLEEKRSKNETFTKPTSDGGPASQEAGEAKDFGDARKRLEAMLAAEPGQ